MTSHTFIQHMALAFAWCRHVGVRDSERNVLRLMYRLSAADLVRLLTEQGIAIPAGCDLSQRGLQPTSPTTEQPLRPFDGADQSTQISG